MGYKEEIANMNDKELYEAFKDSYFSEAIFVEMVVRLFKEKIKKDSEKFENSGNWVL